MLILNEKNKVKDGNKIHIVANKLLTRMSEYDKLSCSRNEDRDLKYKIINDLILPRSSRENEVHG